MADAPKKEEKPAAPTRQRMGVRLAPVDNSDQPVLANYASVSVAPGMAFIDFGFLEPGLLAAIPQVAQQSGKLPQAVNGKLVVRVAMSYVTLAALDEQVKKMLTGVRAVSKGMR